MASGTDPDQETLPYSAMPWGPTAPLALQGHPTDHVTRLSRVPGIGALHSPCGVGAHWGSYLLGDLKGAIPPALVADQQVLGERTEAMR